MAVSFTEDQQKAIDRDGCNILVAAAAGSGKTAVLTERIIKKVTNLDNPQNIDEFLVVTFTDAATSEMKERITKKLESAYDEAQKAKNTKLSEHIFNQLNLLNKAYISTIDSFCLKIVRQNFNTLGIDPNFKFMDNTEEEILKDQILEELFEELYEKNEPDFIEFVKFFSDNYVKDTDNNAKKFIKEVYKNMKSMPYPYKWLDKSVENYNLTDDDSFFNSEISEGLRKYVMSVINVLKSKTDEMLKFLSTDSIAKTVYSEDFYNLKDHFDYFEKLLKKDFKNYIYLCDEKLSLKNASKKNFEDETNKEIFSKLKSDITNTFRDKFKAYAIYFSEESKALVIRTYPILVTAKKIITEFLDRLIQAKKEKASFSFQDISHFALNILSDENGNPTAVAKEFQNKFNEIIMDEYQDIVELQEAILSMVAKNNSNRFMVGDVKQCIYKFRLASPYLFAKKYNTYSTEFDEKCKESGHLINLSKNFRSRECVLSAVNFIFKQIMTEEFSQIKYDENAMLYAGLDFGTPPDDVNIANSVDLEIIDTEPQDDTDTKAFQNDESDELDELTNLEFELITIANKINNMINVEKLHIYDKEKKEYRLLEYKDIAILAHSVKKIAPILPNIFTSFGIPFSANTKVSFFENIEISMMLSFLNVVDNPYQDIDVYTALHSPVYNFTFDELAQIRLSLKDKSFFTAILFYISAENKNRNIEISNKLEKFIEDINEWKDFSLNSSLHELLQKIYDDTGYYDYVGVLPNGDVRRMNLKLLQEKAIAFEKSNSKSLFRFIKFIEQLKEQKAENEQTISRANSNYVTITNIHQSKGLEYPVVILCNSNKGVDRSKIGKFIMDQQLGIGINFKDTEQNISFNTLPRKSLYYKNIEDLISEKIRLLYVALTRAEEKLIIVGSVKSLQDYIDGILKNISTNGDTFSSLFLYYANGSLLKLIIAALLNHKSGNIFSKYCSSEINPQDNLYNDNSVWNIKITNAQDIKLNKTQDENKKKILLEELHSLDVNKDYSGFKDKIKNRLLWTYPDCEFNNIPVTTSISAIKRKIFEEDETIISSASKTPEFLKEYTGLTPAQRGTAVHTLMEHLDFNNQYDIIGLNKFIDKLVKSNILTRQEADSINKDKIMKFLSSEIADRIRNSNVVKRENPFVMGLSPDELLGSEYSRFSNLDNDILVHGIIDLYFEENDNIVLIDYKTDYVEDNNTEVILERYKIQIDLYKKAIEQGTGKKVIEAGLYLFGADCYVKY